MPKRLMGPGTGGYAARRDVTTAIRTIQPMYIILYKYKAQGEKKPGPVRQFRIYAGDLEEAKREAERYANYPDIEVLDVRPA